MGSFSSPRYGQTPVRASSAEPDQTGRPPPGEDDSLAGDQARGAALNLRQGRIEALALEQSCHLRAHHSEVETRRPVQEHVNIALCAALRGRNQALRLVLDQTRRLHRPPLPAGIHRHQGKRAEEVWQCRLGFKG